VSGCVYPLSTCQWIFQHEKQLSSESLSNVAILGTIIPFEKQLGIKLLHRITRSVRLMYARSHSLTNSQQALKTLKVGNKYLAECTRPFYASTPNEWFEHN
jgi:hypothetical protein